MKILFLSTMVFGSEIRRARTVEAEVAEQFDEPDGSAVPYKESPDIIPNGKLCKPFRRTRRKCKRK